ncbi:MAG: tRNA dihydrouridine synthase DusB [Acidobacteriota bacterium]|nr:tRNA dihydrouridine synthase DusB [Acidobacteriota bacterium]
MYATSEVLKSATHYPQAFEIAGRRISPPLVLSPMAGVTDSPFRRLVKKRGGVGLFVTEFISVEGLTRGNIRSHEMMRFKSEERPIAIQIFGYDEVRMRWAAEIAQETGADFVDVNCGCPAKKVINGGGGSNLLRDLPQLEKILKEVKRAITIPMTVKIRAGWDDNSINCVEVAKLIEDCGGSMVTLHGRTRVQAYKGFANWDLVRAIKENVSIPVSGSGDILVPEHAMNRFDTTGCDAVHIGRGAIANPYIFRQTWETMQGLEPYKPTPLELHETLLEFRDLLREHMPEKGVIGRMKMMSAQLLRGVPNGTPLRQMVLRSPTVEEMEPLFAEYFELAETYGFNYEMQSAPAEGSELAECGV